MRVATYYPKMPPMLPGESMEAYTDRLTGADGSGRVPYNHRRNRQCSIGYHAECTDRLGQRCQCPCHRRIIPPNHRSLLSALALLLLALAAPVAAEETVTPLGDRWYRVIPDELVVIPAGGLTRRPVVVCLDEVPGGLDSTPTVNVVPWGGGATRSNVVVTREGFSPVGDEVFFMPYASVVLSGVPGSVYQLQVIVRGKQ